MYTPNRITEPKGLNFAEFPKSQKLQHAVASTLGHARAKSVPNFPLTWMFKNEFSSPALILMPFDVSANIR